MAKKETIQTPRLSPESKEDIRRAIEVMNKGGIILYPTDTIWGLGCDATNADAVRRIYDIKQRTDAKALISLVDSETKVQFYVKEVPEVAWDVMELSERPMTVVFDGGRNLAPNLLAEDGSVAIRITKEAFSKELCMRMKRAIVSTQASGRGTSCSSAGMKRVLPSNVASRKPLRKMKSSCVRPSSAMQKTGCDSPGRQ